MPDKGVPQPPAAAGQAGMTAEILKVLHHFVYSVLSKVLKERGETMTVVDLKNGYERTINRCDSCGLVIAANGTDTGAIVGPWFGKVVCDDCLRAGIVYCSHCGKPHHKETPHKMVCAGCERVFTARIDYDGELCPLCIQAENGGVRINIYGALERY